MKKTATSIEGDLLNLLLGTTLITTVTGAFYRKDTRPMVYDKEDVVVGFLAGLDGQLQEGTLNVDIYVNRIDAGTTPGGTVRDTARCETLENAALQAFQSISAASIEYDLTLANIPETFKADGINQDIVQTRIRFKRITI